VTIESLSKEEKLRFLKALETDEEFRLAVAAKLGLLEILNELRRLREDFNRLYAKGLEHDRRFEVIEKKLLEHDKRFESIENELKKLREDLNRHVQESSKRFEAIERKLLEHDRRFEAIERKLLEHDKRFEAIEKKLEEHSRLLKEHGERIERLERAVGELKAAIGGLGQRMGRDLEKLILNLYRDAIQRFDIDIDRVEKMSIRDVEGRYLHRGAKIELDIYMSDRVTYLIEVKSLVDEEDVEWFNTKCSIFARELGLTSYRKMIVAVNIARQALERARDLGIDVVYGSVID